MLTEALEVTMAAIDRQFWLRPSEQRRCACSHLYSVLSDKGLLTALYAWDISELYELGRNGVNNLGGKQGTGKWARTIQFRASSANAIQNNKVYYAGSANYAMWGRINRLCSEEFSASLFGIGSGQYSLNAAISTVRLYKKVWVAAPKEYEDQAVEFTKWGYDGTPPRSGSDLQSRGALVDVSNKAFVGSRGWALGWSWRGINMTYGLFDGTPMP